MSVIMTLRVQADPKKLEAFAQSNPDHMAGVADAAKSHGALAHRFYGSEDGQIMVVDEWPDIQSFEAFFGENRGQIEPMMREAGAASEPEVTFWRKLDTRDEVGWER